MSNSTAGTSRDSSKLTSWGTRINRLTVPRWVRNYLRATATAALLVAIAMSVRPQSAAEVFPDLAEQRTGVYLIAVVLLSIAAGHLMAASGAPNSIAPYLAGHFIRGAGALLVLTASVFTGLTDTTKAGYVVLILLMTDTVGCVIAWLRVRRLPQ
ncbi:MAG: hypothetical protein ACOCZ9_01080 [Spirochaetota bacterium]